MKQFILLFCLVFMFVSCNNETKDNAASEPAKTDAAAADVKLPFELAGPYRNWQIGSTENVVAAMAGLKAFVDNDFAALAAVTGDSITLDFDNFQTKVSRDTAMNFFKDARKMYNDIKITMYDYVSVISADKKAEWVTLWYKQVWKNEKGVADSLNVVNDIRLENGKMVELDEKSSHFQKK